MHELSIALGMIEELARIARENNAKRVTHVKLKIGKMSGIVTDSLIFVFDAAKLSYPFLSAASISIEEVPITYECKTCRNIFEVNDMYFPSCTECNSYHLKIVSGEEMNIENMEIEV